MSGYGSYAQNQSSSKTRTADYQAGAYKDLRKPVSQTIQDLLAGAGTGDTLAGIPSYQGQTNAPITAAEQNYLSQMQNSATNQSPNVQAANSLTGDTLAGKYLDPASNPFLQSSINAAIQPLRQQYNDVTMPGLRAQFTLNGQTLQGEGSSPFAREYARAANDLNTQIGNISSNMAGQNYTNERNNQMQAVTNANAQQQQQFNQLYQTLQASALPRLIQQQGLDKGLQNFNQQVNWLMQVLGLGAQSSQPVMSQTGNSWSSGWSTAGGGGVGATGGG